MRYYSLFEKRDGQWVQIGELVLTLSFARHVYDRRLKEPGAQRKLGVVPAPKVLFGW